MDNTAKKEFSALPQGIAVALVILVLFFSGNLLGTLGGSPTTYAEEDTQPQEVIASTTESTTQPTTAPITQPTTQTTPDATESPEQSTAPSNEAPSGEMSKAEIIALFNESANKVKTDATKVVKNYEDRELLKEHLDVPSALEGMLDTLMGTAMKDDTDPIEYATKEDIVAKYPVPGETWSSQLTEAEVAEATCTDNGTEYEVYIKLNPSSNPSIGEGVAKAVDTITAEDMEKAPDMIQNFTTDYFDCTIKCKIDKATGHTVWSNYYTPVVFDTTVKMGFTVQAKVGFSFEKDYTITY